MSKYAINLFYVAVASLLLVALTLIPACAPGGGAPTATGAVPAEAKFKVVELTDFSGPASTTCTAITDGSSDYFKYVNDQGGIAFTYQGKNYKVKILHEAIDTRYEVALGVAAYKRTVVEKPPFYITQKSDHAEVLAEPASKDQVPIVAWGVGSGKVVYQPGWVFGTMPPYSQTGGAQVDYLLSQHKEATPLRIAFLTWDNASGRGLIDNEIMGYCKKKGVEVVGTWFYPVAPVDVTAILSKIAEQKPDAILMCAGTDAQIPVAKDAKRIGLSPAGGGKVRLYSYYSCIDWQPLEMAADAYEDSVVTFAQYAVPSETNVPAIKTAIVNAKKYRNSDKLYFCDVIGTTMGHIVVEAAQKALEKHGWPLTGANAYEALQTLGGATLNGMVGGLAFSPTERNGLTKVRMLGVKNGKPVILNDWAQSPSMKSGTWTSSQ